MIESLTNFTLPPNDGSTTPVLISGPLKIMIINNNNDKDNNDDKCYNDGKDNDNNHNDDDNTFSIQHDTNWFIRPGSHCFP